MVTLWLLDLTGLQRVDSRVYLFGGHNQVDEARELELESIYGINHAMFDLPRYL